MRLVATKEEMKLWEMVEPYIVLTNELNVELDENAPDSIKEAYKQYTEIYEKSHKNEMSFYCN